MTFAFFADAGLTVPLNSSNPVAFAQLAAGAPVDRIVYFGSADVGKKLQRATDPGVDALEVSVIDTDAGGGLPVTALTLALSSAGLDTATPGDPVSIGATINSGAANSVPVFVRADADSATPATFTDLLLRVAGALETDA